MRRILASLLILVTGVAAVTTFGPTSAQESDAPCAQEVNGLRCIVVQPGDGYIALARRAGFPEPERQYTTLSGWNNFATPQPGEVIWFNPDLIPAPTTTTVAPTTTVPPPTTEATTTTSTTSTTTTTVPPTTTTTVPPEPEKVVMVGAAVDRQSGQSWAQATEAFEAQIGATLDITRRFTSTFPTSFNAVGSFAVDVGKRHRFISVKGEPTLAQWITFIASIPADGFDTYVTINHEPENDGGIMTPTYFKSKQALMLQAIRQSGRTDVIPSFVLMSWAERDGNPATSSALWFPDEPWAFTLGLDPYDPNNVSQMTTLVSQTISLWKAAGGTDWMITETGTKRTGSNGVLWIENTFNYCRIDPDCLAVMWFHSAVGDNGPWWLPTGVMSVAYGAQKGQFAVAA